MNILVCGAALLIGLMGVVGCVRPATLMALVSRMRSQRGLWIATVVRVLLGVALWLAAPASRFPQTLQVLAVITLLAGVLLPFVGLRRFEAIIDWWSAWPEAVLRIWSVVVIAFAAFLFWAALA